jgi:hypothetical protein
MQLKPLGKNIIFTFLESTGQGGFIPSSGGRILITQQNIQNNTLPKWAKVFLVGPDVDPEIKVGEYIFIEPLMWSVSFEYDGVQFWKTDATKILITSEEVPDFSF